MRGAGHFAGSHFPTVDCFLGGSFSEKEALPGGSFYEKWHKEIFYCHNIISEEIDVRYNINFSES